MKGIIFLGTDYRSGKGGVASVLEEYAKIFPDAKFISTTKSVNYFRNLLQFFKAFVQLFFILIKSSNNIIHIHGSSYNSFNRKYVFFKLSKFFGAKIIYHIHGAEYHLFYKNSTDKTQKRIKEFINNADCIICLSNSWKYFFNDIFCPKRVVIISNIVAKPILNKKIGGKGLLSFLFLGHISGRKGIWLLLDVIRENFDRINGNAKFYIGGNGDIEKLKSQIVDYNLEEIVEFIGWVSNEKKVKFFNKADIFILPSFNEGLPISILEAMTYSLPVISTNVGGIPEIISNNQNGILIEPGSKDQLRDAIFYMINNPKEVVRYGAASSEIIVKHLPKSVLVKLKNLYKSI